MTTPDADPGSAPGGLARRVARVTLQFHPDWPYRDGLVIESMVHDGRYRSQFETGTSNGGLTAHPGGDRFRWESRLFAGQYDSLPAHTRPVYGAWNRRGDFYGGSPRFGSAYFRLTPETAAWSTFCFPDSVHDPTEVGGEAELPRLVQLADQGGQDYLDDYIEAHVHRPVFFATHVEALVLDLCHRDGVVREYAEQLGCPIEFHHGFRVDTAWLDRDYRGEEPVRLAQSLARTLTPDRLAEAARSGKQDPQTVKYAWHLLARFGRKGSKP